MSPVRAMLHRIRGLFFRERLEREMSDEMRAHLDELAERNVAAGMSPEEARYAALRAFGGVAQIAERARDERRSAWGEQLVQDLRYGSRQMRKHPVFAAIVMLILGLGIGVNTTVFSALEILLWRTLPVSKPEQLVLFRRDRALGTPNASSSNFVSLSAIQHLRERTQSLTGVLLLSGSGGSRSFALGNAGRDGAMRIATSDVSGNYFSLLQVRPGLGRLITPADDRREEPRAVAVLSHAFWQDRLGGDPAIVGRTVRIENVPLEIIGVAAPGFFGVKVGAAIDVWTPLEMLPQINPRLGVNLRNASWGGLNAMGRLRAGVPLAAAAAEVEVLYQQQGADLRPQDSPETRIRTWGKMALEPGTAGFASDARIKGGPFFGMLLVVVTLVQIIACANVASLSFARLAARQRELAARTALGAGRGRLARQLATETLLLVAGGALLGGIIVHWSFLTARAHGIIAQPGGRTFVFGLLVVLLTSLVVAVLPALRCSRIDLSSALKNQSAGAGARQRLPRLLVVVQLAVSGCLLAGTSLFVRSLNNLWHIDLGYGAEKLLLTGIVTPPDYAATRRAQVTREVLQKLSTLPGVRSVTISAQGFLTGGEAAGSISVDGLAAEERTARFVLAGPDYFETVGLPLLRGRGLEMRDIFPDERTGVAKAVISEAVAERLFGKTDPIGQRFHQGKADYEVVGITRNTKYRRLREETSLVCYLPYGSFDGWTWSTIGVQIRTVDQPRAIAASVAAVLKQIDANLTVLPPETMADVMRRNTREEQLAAAGIGGFSVLALVLTSLGLYGLLACQVAQRTREIGVRIALGGKPGDIIALILKQGLALTLTGWAAGTVASIVLVRFVAARLYEVSPGDPLTLLASGVLLTFVALVACWLPARRATKVDPMVSLRAE